MVPVCPSGPGVPQKPRSGAKSAETAMSPDQPTNNPFGNGGGSGPADGWRGVRYAEAVRYPDGGGLTAEERARRERVRRRGEAKSSDEHLTWADVTVRRLRHDAQRRCLVGGRTAGSL